MYYCKVSCDGHIDASGRCPDLNWDGLTLTPVRHIIVPDAMVRSGLWDDCNKCSSDPPKAVQVGVAQTPGGRPRYYVFGRQVTRDEFYSLMREGTI